ncbi:OLC1v1021255C1 [Oldenlandia corymbosa var. corymbosa]|uniref:OLC1v1021255C1 n=1 Tax=Oldenlandia corymbosa var. corymbosa TaxID=529605 RepID=A0AAV1BVT8_OLDCO|nr:OLC1v1021255C1 [Oldenlandia corymbosa var. corymbosa]
MDLFTMNSEQNNTPNTSTSVILPAKRRRGRPRKDGVGVNRGEGNLLQSPTISESNGMRPIIHQNEAKSIDRGGMVGRIVTGVIDGCFDAGYFVSVRIGNNGPPLRGVIFESGRVTPVSSDNDVAPNAKLYQRNELPIPSSNPQCQVNGISPQSEVEMHNVCSQVFPSINGLAANNAAANNSRSSLVEQTAMQQNPSFGYLSRQTVLPAQNLRMVEQDEMMQVYEVSVQSEGLMEDAVSAKDWMSESSARLNQNLVSVEPKSGIQETTTSSSEAKQNQLAYNNLKGSFQGSLHESCLIVENHPLPHQESLAIDKRLQIEPEAQLFQLHDTPIVDQTPCIPSAIQQNDRFHTFEKLPSKLADCDLERQNFGILRDLMAGNNHHFLPPEVISDQPAKLMMEKPNPPQVNSEKATFLEPCAAIQENNNKSRDITEQQGNDVVNNNDELRLGSQSAQRTKEAMPFDLELAAEESSCPTNNASPFSESDPR